MITDSDVADSPADAFDNPPFDADARSRFTIAVLLALASPFLVDALAFAISKVMRGESLVVSILFGLVVAKFGLLAMWLAWGGSRAFWRMLVVMMSLFLTSLAAPVDRNNTQLFVILFLINGVCALVIALPRLLDVRWIVTSDWRSLAKPDTGRRYQFSIIDILVWTTMAAVLAGLIQWIGFPAGVDLLGLLVVLIAPTVLGAAVLVAMWAELGAIENIGGRIGAAYLFAILLALVTGMLWRAPGEAVAYILLFFLSGMSGLLTVLYVLRCAGHRWVGKKRLLVPSD